MPASELIYDWNVVAPSHPAPGRHIGFDDETLRDGLQSPSVCEPSVEKKLELLHLMDDLKIDTADIGLPGAGGTHAAGVERLAREIADERMQIRPNCAARACQARPPQAPRTRGGRSAAADRLHHLAQIVAPLQPTLVRGVEFAGALGS